jgi:hypothetical protein
MAYGNRRATPKAMLDRELGLDLMRQLRIKDDGFSAHGGVMATIVGPRGSGKTTFEIQLAEGSAHLPHGQKNRTLDNLYPETVIWRGRQYEYFNTMFPSWWEKETGIHGKPVYIHMAEGCDYEFFCDEAGKRRVELDLSETEIIYYKDIAQLIKENIVKEAINVVFEPQQYIIPADVVKQFSLKRLQFKPVNKQKETESEEEEFEEEEVKPQRKKREKEFVDTEAPSELFWYEFVDKLMQLKKREDFFSIIIDESGDVFPKTVMSEWYHMCSYFSKSIADMRRFNISITLATHEIGFVYYEIRRMSDFMIYMPGSRPDGSFTRVSQFLPTILNIGEFIIEVPMTRFGLATFPRLNQAPLVTVEGMSRR